VTSYCPATVDGQDIPADAPRSQGMSDQTASDLKDFADGYRADVMHLHADVAGRDVTLTAANCADGVIVFAFGDGAADVEDRVDGGSTPTASHTYLTDGVFAAVLRHENGDRADLEIAINWPPFPSEATP
jgi:hypothetical protein